MTGTGGAEIEGGGGLSDELNRFKLISPTEEEELVDFEGRADVLALLEGSV